MVRKVERELQDRRLKNGVKRDLTANENEISVAMKRDLEKAKERLKTETDEEKRAHIKGIIYNIESFLSKYDTK